MHIQEVLHEILSSKLWAYTHPKFRKQYEFCMLWKLRISYKFWGRI